MADLPVQAQRINDIEVSANAPQTESLWRRFGSNINYILDFLGINNGDPLSGGANFQGFVNALTLISTHTVDLVANIPAGGASANIVTAQNTIPFVNEIFYLNFPTPTTFSNYNVNSGTGGNYILGSVEFDGGGFNPLSSVPTGLGITNTGYERGDIYLDTAINAQKGSKAFRHVLDGPIIGSTPANLSVKFAEIDWRDCTQYNLAYTKNTSPIAYEVYRAYALNIASLPF